MSARKTTAKAHRSRRRKPPVRVRQLATFSLSDEARELLAELAERWGETRSGMVERLIRERARRDGLWRPGG